DKIFALRHRQLIPMKPGMNMLERLGRRHPCVYLVLLFGAEGHDEQIHLSREISRQAESVFGEGVSGQTRKDSVLRGPVLRCESAREERSAERGGESKVNGQFPRKEQ